MASVQRGGPGQSPPETDRSPLDAGAAAVVGMWFMIEAQPSGAVDAVLAGRAGRLRPSR
ncbi:hypothetical protein [Streptacidiphilus albus]|uniref:hypothetical protein n=1 Tax=Streptacidiphilus albus TaxID=105425 RepID=UPI000A8F8840|nr:hypothetical protein [Streptacidiphilus albus]